MPHPREIRKYFGRRWRERTRPRIMRRAIAEAGLKTVFWELGLRPSLVPCERCHRWVARQRIQIAHLYLAPGVPGHDADENLAALCDRCHHAHDYASWAWACYETRAKRKDAERPLLEAMTTPAAESATWPVIKLPKREA